MKTIGKTTIKPALTMTTAAALKTSVMLILAMAMTACVSVDHRLKTLSTQPISRIQTNTPMAATPAAKDKASEKTSEKISGSSCRKDLLFFIAFEKGGQLEDAVDDALSKAPAANVLTDVTVRHERLMTGFYNYRCITVEGRALQVAN